MSKYVSQSHFSRVSGLHPDKVRDLMRGKLKDACVGASINLEHEIVVAYLKNEDAPRPVNLPNNIAHLADMSLRDLITQFGTDLAFIDWLKATKMIEDIAEKRIKNAEKEGRLVDRDLIKRGVIEPVDTCFTQILNDGAKTIVKRIQAMVKSDYSVEEMEEFIRSQITSFVRPMKEKISKNLRDSTN
jgi:hypothetical protein